jgi:hypothetical protein
VGGYIWNEELTNALRTNQAARRAVGQILDENPGSARRAMLLALVARYLGDNLESLRKLQEITNGKETS